MTNSLNIGQLASAADTPAPTIRYYEKIGLLSSPVRSAGNYRCYSTEDVAKLMFVRRARDLGFTIDQVRDLLDLSDQRELDCGTVMQMTRQHLAEIEQKIADLTALKEQLSGLLTSCGGGAAANCKIIEALKPLAPARGVRPGTAAGTELKRER